MDLRSAGARGRTWTIAGAAAAAAVAVVVGGAVVAGGCASAPARPVTKIVNGRIVVTRPVSPQAYEHVTRALLYEDEERWEEAARELQQALSLDNEAAEVRAHLGELFIRLGRLDDAAEQVTRSLEIAPTVEGRLAAAGLAEARRDRKRALGELRQAAALSLTDDDPGAVERTHLALADAQLGALDPRGAIRTVRALCGVAPDSLRARVQRAALAWALGERADAEAAIAEALVIEPGELEARLMLGALLAATGQTDRAKTAFREAVERSEGAIQVIEMYLRWLVARGDRDEAAAEADRLVPDTIGEDTVETVVRIERAAGRPERARAAADKALDRGARPVAVALLAAGALAEAKDRAGAAARLLKIPRDAPEAVEARLRAAELYREGGKLAEAERALAEADAAAGAASEKAARAAAAAAAGGAGGSGGGGAAAAGGAGTGAGVGVGPPRDWSAELAIGRALLDEKRGDAARAARTLDAALAQAEAAAAREPVKDFTKIARLLLVRAAVEERRGEWRRALGFVARVLETEPRHIEALNFHGFVAADHAHDLPSAMRRLEVAMALNPGAGGIVDSLGWAYFRAGDRARAADLLGQADRLEPGDPEILDHLGDLHAQGQDVPRALAAYREALRRDPPERLVRKLETRVRELEAKSQAATSPSTGGAAAGAGGGGGR